MKAAQVIKKIRIGVLMGGKSIEQEVSFNSGRTVCDHLDTQRFEVLPLFQSKDGTLFLLPWHFLHRGKITDFKDRLAREAQQIAWDDLQEIIDFMYIAVHGRFAEDGTLQGMLEVLNIPYLGAGVFGSAMRMNKSFHKNILHQAGVSVPRGIVVRDFDIETVTQEQLIDQLYQHDIMFPVVVKPSGEGSSLGVSMVHNSDQLLSAVYAAGTVDQSRFQDVLVEQKIEGMEFVCVLLQHPGYNNDEWFSLPLTEVVIEQNKDIFDYDQKYMPGRAQKIVPARVSGDVEKNIVKTCVNVAQILQFCTIARIDGFVGSDGEIYIIDPNSLTGMAPSSFIFHQAAEHGMSHTDLINFLIDAELTRSGVIQGLSFGEDAKNMLDDNEKKIRVGVLFAGESNEREVSLESGRNVCYKLSPDKYDVIPLFLDKKLQLYKLPQRILVKNSTTEIADSVTADLKVQWDELPTLCDFVFNTLHGGKGENGAVQGALEMLSLPYNGSDVLVSGLCSDKYKTNQFLQAAGFDVPNSVKIERKQWLKLSKEKKQQLIKTLTQAFTFPLIIKPHDDGCSVMVNKVATLEQALTTCDKIFEQQKDGLMIEEFVRGMELTAGVYGNRTATCLPPSYSIAKEDILSIEEKFLPGEGQNITPAPLETCETTLVQQTLEQVYQAIGCTGYVRIDCFYQNKIQSPTGKPRVVILEINTLPALTPATCLFHQAAEVGIRPMEFIDTIVELGFQRYAETHRQKLLQSTNRSDTVTEVAG